MPLKSSQGDESANMGHQAENLNIMDYSIYLTDYCTSPIKGQIQRPKILTKFQTKWINIS